MNFILALSPPHSPAVRQPREERGQRWSPKQGLKGLPHPWHSSLPSTLLAPGCCPRPIQSQDSTARFPQHQVLLSTRQMRARWATVPIPGMDAILQGGEQHLGQGWASQQHCPAGTTTPAGWFPPAKSASTWQQKSSLFSTLTLPRLHPGRAWRSYRNTQLGAVHGSCF